MSSKRRIDDGAGAGAGAGPAGGAGAADDGESVPVLKRLGRFATVLRDHGARAGSLPDRLEEVADTVPRTPWGEARAAEPGVRVPATRRVRRRKDGVSIRDLPDKQIQVYTNADPLLRELVREAERGTGGAGAGAGAGGAMSDDEDGDAPPPQAAAAIFENDRAAFFTDIMHKTPYWARLSDKPLAEGAVQAELRPVVAVMSAERVHRSLCVPYDGRRMCVSGNMCVARLLDPPDTDGHIPLTAMELLTEIDDAHFVRTNEHRSPPTFCYFCRLYCVHLIQLSIARTETPPEQTYTPFQHEVGVPGGYTIESCIQPKATGLSEGMIHPFRIFNCKDYVPTNAKRATRNPQSPPLRDHRGQSVAGWNESGDVFF